MGAPLDAPGVHHRGILGEDLADVDVAQGPVVVARAGQVRELGRGVGMVPLRARRGVDLGVQQRHLRELPVGAGQEPGEVLGHRGGGVAHGGDVAHGLALLVVDGDALGRGVAHNPHVGGPVQGAGAGLGASRIVVPRGVDHGDAVVGQAAHLLQEEALGLEGEALVVEEVPGQQHGVDVFPDGQVHPRLEGVPGRLAEAAPDGLGASGEGGVQVDVGQVDEAHA